MRSMSQIVIIAADAEDRHDLAQLASGIEAAAAVSEFAAPQQALDWMRTEVPDLVIVDGRMAKLDVAAFARHLRAAAPTAEVPLIVITAPDDAALRLGALAAGASDFLQAPVDAAQFTARVRNLLALHRRHAGPMRANPERLAQVLDALPAMVSATDRQGRCIFLNAGRARLLGVDVGLAPGPPLGFDAAQARRDRELDAAVFATGERLPAYEEEITDGQGVHRLFLVEKLPLRDGAGAVTAVLTSAFDITDRQRRESHLQFIATHDALTGLPNRLLLQSRLQQAVQEARHRGLVFALHFLDIDRFAAINDAFGHHVGDHLLQQVAERLRDELREVDLIARLGGDEFAVIQKSVQWRGDATALAGRIERMFGAPFMLDGRAVNISTSLGITLFPRDGTSIETLLKNADLAMYQSKSQGRNTFRFFEPRMQASVEDAVQMEMDLRTALAEHQFVLYYQPQVDLASFRVRGTEALLRWRRPSGELLAAGAFLPLAERTGLIVPINTWVLNEVCRHAAGWQREGLAVRVAVNISADLFARRDVHRLVLEAIDAAGLEPSLLELELTETMLLADLDAARAQLHDLQRLGVSFTVDDFGTGYASLTYINRLPVDRLKIDQSFIRDLRTQAGSLAIVRAILGLARNLNLTAIAEGVETAAELAVLRAEGCQAIQGNYFGEPLPADAFEALLRAGGRLGPG
jgi:diguanylate cyclase (GGDEF)-like protein/PAS domain S-box-containing protein